MPRSSFGNSFVILLASFLASCTTFSRTPRQPDGQIASLAQARGLCSAVAARSQELKSLRLLSKSVLTTGSDSYLVNHVIVIEYPNRLRIETLAPNAAIAMNVLTSDGQSALILDSAEERAIQTDNPTSALAARFRMSASVLELNYLLAGRIWHELSSELVNKLSEVKRLPETGNYEFYSSGRIRLEWQKESGLLSRAQKYSPWNDELLYSVAYNSYTTKQGITLPDLIVLKLPKDSVELQLNLTTIKPNSEIPERLFRQEIPPNFTRLRLGEGSD